MKIEPLHPEIEAYLEKRNLTKKYEKQKKLFEKLFYYFFLPCTKIAIKSATITRAMCGVLAIILCKLMSGDPSPFQNKLPVSVISREKNKLTKMSDPYNIEIK